MDVVALLIGNTPTRAATYGSSDVIMDTNEPPKSLDLLEIPPNFHWDAGKGFTPDFAKTSRQRISDPLVPDKPPSLDKLTNVVLNLSEYGSMSNENKARYDFRWISDKKKRMLRDYLLGQATRDFFDYEYKTYLPEVDRLSRDSQHRAWNGYAWEII